MEGVLHANTFFYIASAATILFTILVCVLLYHVIKIVRAVRRIVERVEVGSETFVAELEELRHNLNPARLLSFIMKFFPAKRRRYDDEE